MAPCPIVYVLFRETNTGHFDESDGYIDAVYATAAAAEAARLAAIRGARDRGVRVWFDPDDPAGAEQDSPADWEADWRVEAWKVQP